MSKARTLAKLQLLLERVRSRSADPRVRAATAAPRDAVMEVTLPPASSDVDAVDLSTLPPPPSIAPPGIHRAPPPPPAPPPGPASAPAARSSARDVGVGPSDTGPELTVVGAEVASVEPELEVTLAEPESPIAGGAAPADRDAPASLDAEPPDGAPPLEAAGSIPLAPESSRRMVVEPEERLAEMAFGADEPAAPLHTPPPESGRLPAAAVEEFDADVTGVRAAPHSPEGAARMASGLSPQVTRPTLSADDAVAELAGQPRAPEPHTFAAWLDATLSLRCD